MGRHIVLLLTLLAIVHFLTGCNSSANKGRIVGKWDSVETNVNGEQVPAGFMNLDFRVDGKMVYKAGPQTFRGTYTLGGGNKVTFHLDRPLAGRRDHVQTVTIYQNQLTVIDSDGTQMTFNRVD